MVAQSLSGAVNQGKHDNVRLGKDGHARRQCLASRASLCDSSAQGVGSAALATIVEFDRIGLRYGTGGEVLRDLDFRLGAGQFYFLTGPSGAGKTSLLKLLYLAQRPTRGRLSLFGEELTDAPREVLPAFRRRIGVVFQDFRLVRHLSAFDNVALPLRVAGHSESDVEGPVREMLAWVGLADRASARPPTLSGGEQQRVAIARAVIARPELLVADEPTGNVDPEMAARLLHLFDALNKLGTTVVVATHDIHLIARIARSEMLRLDKGQISDPTGALRHPPRKPGR
jgi:cell division transport system ATP-binding protein